jgi:uncharacterized protein
MLRVRQVAIVQGLLACIVLLLLATAAIAQPKFPTLTGRVVDQANILSADDRRALEADLKALEDKSTDQLVVYTAPTLQGYEIEDFGYQLGRVWKIGQQDKNNGVILIIAPKERKVRIEVGRGLEPQLTDIMSKLIVENAILPAFRRGDFPAGIKAGVRDIRDVILGDAEAVKARARVGAKRTSDGPSALPVIILMLMVAMAFYAIWAQSRETAHPGAAAANNQRGRRDRRGRRQAPVIVPDVTWGGSSGGWDSGSSGGGFSGGGGDFGGGGASGSW